MPKIRDGVALRTVLVLFSLLVITVVLVALQSRHPSISREHGPMENFQALCLALGTVALGVLAWRVREPAFRAFLAGTCMFYLTFLFLEFDVRPFRQPVLTLVLNGPIRNALLVAGWAWIGWLAWRNRPGIFQAAARWMRGYSAVLLALAGVCWIAGAAVEKAHAETFFAEELFEVHASLLMALSAFHARWPRGSHARLGELAG